MGRRRNGGGDRLPAKTVSEILSLIHHERYALLEERVGQLLKRMGGDGFLYKALSLALICQGRHVEALLAADRGLELAPRDAELHSNRGISLSCLGRYRTALASFRTAIGLNAKDPELFCNLGAALIQVRDYANAVPALLEAVRLHPGDYPQPVGLLGTALQFLRRYAEAYVCYQQLALHSPQDAGLLAEKLFCSLRLCQWEDLSSSFETLGRQLRAGACSVTSPFAYQGIPGLSRKVLMELSQVVARASVTLANDVPGARLDDVAVAPAKRKLRVGYMSADFREHAVGYLFSGVIEAHDKGEFEWFAYSCGKGDGSPLESRLREAFTVFRDIYDMAHDRVARMIRDDGVDILVDLSGWTVEGRPEVLALRPAPVQATWLGYPGTLGHPILADYLIGDPFVSPLDEADTFAETLALLPHCYLPNDDTRRIGPRPSREEAGLPEKGFVFCSFNQSFKIQPRIFDVWCRLLQEVAGSVLWLANYPDATRERLRAEAEKRGVAGERLIFAAFCKDNADHLGRLQLADLALDTTPYNSHTTGCDALWAGVPLVAVRGETFAASVSTSLLHAVGLAELVAGDLEGYFSLARDLALSPDRLVATRERLARNRENAPLFDTKRFARDLETLYREMWAQHCTGLREPIVIAPRTWEAAHG